MADADVHEITGAPWVTVGSDANALATSGVTGQGKPHPRYYGTHARILGPFVRDLRLLTLEQAIAKMTGAAAAGARPPGSRPAAGRRVGGRGRVRPGADRRPLDVPRPAPLRGRRLHRRRQRPGRGRRRRSYGRAPRARDPARRLTRHGAAGQQSLRDHRRRRQCRAGQRAAIPRAPPTVLQPMTRPLDLPCHGPARRCGVRARDRPAGSPCPVGAPPGFRSGRPGRFPARGLDPPSASS